MKTILTSESLALPKVAFDNNYKTPSEPLFLNTPHTPRRRWVHLCEKCHPVVALNASPSEGTSAVERFFETMQTYYRPYLKFDK
ncbi:hypothetical protein NTJ28_001650 [Flavobacterium psychrophilum]|nr:hypothetical protein [Flavobacterium psychrophilum]EKT4510509.1 hypothetical protein [Flavobacterium psychrophilum]